MELDGRLAAGDHDPRRPQLPVAEGAVFVVLGGKIEAEGEEESEGRSERGRESQARRREEGARGRGRDRKEAQGDGREEEPREGHSARREEVQEPPVSVFLLCTYYVSVCKKSGEYVYGFLLL